MWLEFSCSHIITALIFVFVIIALFRLSSEPANLPPGPFPWPVVGNLLAFTRDPLQTMVGLKKQYGDVYRVYMGNVLVVHVHGSQSIKQVLQSEDFLDRPPGFVMKVLFKGMGIISTSGSLWKEQRKFATHTLGCLGFGKTTFEGNIHQEILILIRDIAANNENTFCVKRLLDKAVANVLCSIVFGKRFEYDDPKFQRHFSCIHQSFRAIGMAGILNYLPWVKHLPGDLFEFHETLSSAAKIEDFVRDQIDIHKKTIDEDNPRDFIDEYLIEIKKQDTKTSFDEKQMAQVIYDLFISGSETTSLTLTWGLLYLTNHPEVQTKLRQEIQKVVGENRLPSMADRKHMPVTEATILEVQRCADVAPLGGAHAAVDDTTLLEYNIPKGTTVVPVLTSLHKNPNVWANPEIFDPTRFLDETGEVLRREEFLPFGAGKRVCLGEPLARMELYLFLTAIIQRFVFKVPEGVETLSEEGLVGATRTPKPFKIRAIATDQNLTRE